MFFLSAKSRVQELVKKFKLVFIEKREPPEAVNQRGAMKWRSEASGSTKDLRKHRRLHLNICFYTSRATAKFHESMYKSVERIE